MDIRMKIRKLKIKIREVYWKYPNRIESILWVSIGYSFLTMCIIFLMGTVCIITWDNLLNPKYIYATNIIVYNDYDIPCKEYTGNFRILSDPGEVPGYIRFDNGTNVIEIYGEVIEITYK